MRFGTALLVCVAVFGSEWHRVVEVRGQGTKQTDTFQTKGSKWRFKWNVDHEATIVIIVRDKDRKSIAVASGSGAQPDESYIHQAGEFYLDIASNGSFVITVEDFY